MHLLGINPHLVWIIDLRSVWITMRLCGIRLLHQALDTMAATNDYFHHHLTC